MKKRVRRTQTVTILDILSGRIFQRKVKHDSTRPVRMDEDSRVKNYTTQNGGQWLTRRQAKRLNLKGQGSDLQVRGWRP